MLERDDLASTLELLIGKELIGYIGCVRNDTGSITLHFSAGLTLKLKITNYEFEREVDDART